MQIFILKRYKAPLTPQKPSLIKPIKMIVDNNSHLHILMIIRIY